MRVFHGWVIVGGAFAVLFVAYGTQYSFGVFFSALLEEFGWSRASVAGVFSLYAFTYSVLAFPAGRLTDLWGPRTVIGLGGCFLGVALAGMALVTELWQPYLLYGGVAAVGMGTAYVPCNATVVKWFVRRRGLAVGIASSGGSAGTFALPLVAQLLVAAIGWRAAYVVFGAAVLIVLNLVGVVMRRDPESMGLRPDGEAQSPDASVPDAHSWPFRRAIRTAAFWLLAAAFSATWLPVFIPLVHIVQHSRDLGFSPLISASVVSALGVGAVLGRVVTGTLSDRLGRKASATASMALQAIAFVGFAMADTLPLLYVTALVYGYSYGAVSTLFPALVGDVFGRMHAGALVGALFALAGSMGGWGPLVAGLIHDTTGAYTLAFALGAALNIAAAVLLLPCRPPRRRAAVAA